MGCARGGVDTDTDADDVVDGSSAASCADHLAADASAQSGTYTIDLDGEGGADGFDVHCDMETDGGGWTRFWWSKGPDASWDTVTDVLGAEIWDCAPDAVTCFARIPVAAPSELLATDGLVWATWSFDDATPTAAQALAAFVDRIETPMVLDRYDGAWNPVRQSDGLPQPFRCDGTPGGDVDCEQFWYSDMGGIKSFNLDDDGGWAHQAFAAGADNGGGVGVDFFEQGLRNNGTSLPGLLSYR